ncbi:hypothetical protein VTJ83DRAFT_5041 [Remersonia thermophila]|uniref:DNA mismatch repair protein MutL n=1 Tax=Remersonia thermophila TaxID=72144 RepID=A0ABR4DDQ9_9PEZI
MASNATIKAIDSSTIHQIQSGQVIVDLCSVAKELVENSLDAGATTIDVRFKNQGLDSIEVQDNGAGIASHNYESVALKHYTSKLSTYDDLTELQTFGFRGEALSSLCALSRFSIVTCTQQEAPRATRLEFETSGKLKSTLVVSGQRGTTVIVENLFYNLPVRRRELERNIKREWGKVIALLNQYACIQTGVKFTVSQQPNKGKRMVLFSTKGNPTTRENIINVFGVKTMNALVAMDLRLELVPSAGPLTKGKARADGSSAEVRVVGHISRPAHGEGRQTPDRQMFYVNGRPCGLPQFAKVFNEVYRTYNSSQSPFIFADIRLDTHLYDVNVSPDKRTILLHDQGQMLDNLRESLIELFEKQDVTIPIAKPQAPKPTPSKAPASARSAASTSTRARNTAAEPDAEAEPSSPLHPDRPSHEDDDDDDDDDDDTPRGAQDDEGDESEGEGDPISDQAGAAKGNKPKVSPPASRSTNRPAATADIRMILSQRPAGRAVIDRERSEGGQAKLNEDGVGGDIPSNTTVANEEPAHETVKAGLSDSVAAGTVTEAANENSVDQPSPSADLAAPTADSERSTSPQLDNEPEPSVPAIPPPSQPPSSRPILLASSRPPKRPTQEATITIGDHTVSVAGSSAKRPRVSEASGIRKPAGSSIGTKRKAPLPSFGGRLTQLFSAAAARDSSSADPIEETTEGSDEEMEAYDDEDEGGTEGERAMEDEEEEEDEAGEESLFVSQSADAVMEDEEDDHEEPTPSSPRPTPKNATNAPSSPAHEEAPDASHSCHGDHGDDDGDYVDEDEKKAQEDEKVQAMIDAAEAAAAPTEEGERRSELFVKGRSRRKDMTVNLAQRVKTSLDDIERRIASLAAHLPPPSRDASDAGGPEGLDAADAEEKLSLKITKSDFAKMRIVGQFNLGFILAVREAAAAASPGEDADHAAADDDELFIIDQHASDEKYNFERLQATTTVQSQRLVQPKALELTALEEEIILEHIPQLERNGFQVAVDTSGAKPVGQRVQLLSLPLSRETTFSVADLEELVFLLGDNPTSSPSTVPRPSKVRKMFAMRACRSSIMIGRALSARQMARVVRHMGEMDKPWNCPHGRPTMRHLCGLGAWDGRGWREEDRAGGQRTNWAAWARERRGEEE